LCGNLKIIKQQQLPLSYLERGWGEEKQSSKISNFKTNTLITPHPSLLPIREKGRFQYPSISYFQQPTINNQRPSLKGCGYRFFNFLQPTTNHQLPTLLNKYLILSGFSK
jgi:hypothetical protein